MPEAAAAAAAGTVHTCPMHPEIRQDRPGNFPKCGMTLEPVLPNAVAVLIIACPCALGLATPTSIMVATGRGLTTARAVGQRLGIEEVHGEVKPADKLKLVEKLQAEGRVVAMAGAMASTTPPRWPAPMSASRWAPALTWR